MTSYVFIKAKKNKRNASTHETEKQMNILAHENASFVLKNNIFSQLEAKCKAVLGKKNKKNTFKKITMRICNAPAFITTFRIAYKCRCMHERIQNQCIF